MEVNNCVRRGLGKIVLKRGNRIKDPMKENIERSSQRREHWEKP